MAHIQAATNKNKGGLREYLKPPSNLSGHKLEHISEQHAERAQAIRKVTSLP